jgi:hypothetical protein
LTGFWPWEDFPAGSSNSDDNEQAAANAVIAGKRPAISTNIKTSKNVEEQVLLKAIELCWIHDPKERASASQVVELLGEALKHLQRNDVVKIAKRKKQLG